MLRNVLGDYLSNVREREFDLPFISLLPSMGFYDIHFTHGQVEFGKDFIAKRVEDDVEIQYSFQSKAGDVNQSTWRNDIMGQMLESVLTSLAHPNFNSDLPHQAVLVITGKLTGNAALGLQSLNDRIENTYKERSIRLWDRELLIDYLEEYGLEGLYSATASGFVGYGDFYVLYGKSLQGFVSEDEIEKHSRQWLKENVERDKRLLGAALESEIISQKCVRHGFFCEAIHTNLGVLRTILFELHNLQDSSTIAVLLEICSQARKKLHSSCESYISEFQASWQSADKDLVRIIDGPGSIVTYLIKCARVIEISGYLYFSTDNLDMKREVAYFINEFVSKEPGCAHIPCDRYAISLIFPVIALYDSSFEETAYELIRQSAIWLCDRYEDGFGLAPFGASPDTEIFTLLGYPFDFIPTQAFNDSFLATVISDLAAFLGNEQLYTDIVNDIKATKIFPQYWQVSDSQGLFFIEGEDVVSYPNIEYSDSLTEFSLYDYAEHIIHETRSFSVTQYVNPLSLMALMLLLRDRYFPTLWCSLLTDTA